jgi:2-methylcitrate dehydratase PrpD
VELVSEALAGFAADLSLDSVPEVVIQKAKLSMLDAVGTALLSSGLEKSKHSAKAVRRVSSGGQSAAWGLRFSASPLESALVNGMLIEGLDYSDIHVQAGLHPTSVVLPAVVASGETKGASGEEVLLCHMLGCEMMIRFGLSAPGKFHAHGFQPTSAIGVLGSALATSKMLGLPPRKIEEALSVATTLAFTSSLSVRVGAYFGGLDSGRAAESGMLAAILAREGVAGIARDSIEGRFGFLETCAGPGNYDAKRITKGLGKTWEMKDIFLKRYPTSYACTPTIDAAIRVRRTAGFRTADVEEVRFGENAPNIGLFSEPEESKRRPASLYEAKTSQYFLLSLALTFGKVAPQMLQTKLADKAVLELSDKVGYELDEKSHWVEVRMKDGRVFRETEEKLVPTSEAAVRKKFHENAEGVLGQETAARVESLVDSLEGLRDIGELTSLLKGGKASPWSLD